MPRAALLPLILFACSLTRPAARAADFAIDVDVKSGKATRKAEGQAADPRQKAKARGVLEVKAGSKITVKWVVRSTAKKDTFKDVTLHFFVVKEEKAGQKDVPKLTRDVAAESALTMDFEPGDKSHGDTSLQIDTPGTYLLRLETLDAVAAGADHEYFAALDLVVK
jgi:hypothetical protein